MTDGQRTGEAELMGDKNQTSTQKQSTKQAFLFQCEKNKQTKLNKKCYNKIVITSIALEIVPKIHRKKVFLFSKFTHCVVDQRTCDPST